ncbi:MAG TPA: nucleoside hydrolase [Actinophytocola sp.]|uniref:nucleoside hydrolase n=1 Tax=Actinophytocola sp. TaxID=1872138 RepID=UPI002DDD2B5A|nr:nucleoside hydrolase [Actinophytocola sp.]HEV2780454.1 nucleoside hydrolase [Actinophytocola sp.]
MLRLRALVVIVAVVGSLLAAAGAAEAHRVGRPTPVIYDSDMDFDDATTLAYLCEEHKQRRIELRAVTVANNGMGLPGRALRHARSVLEQCGLPRVPLADGSTGAGVHPAPAEAAAQVETVLTDALGDGGRPAAPAGSTAPELIRRTIALSPVKITMLTTGPLTNVAAALDGRPWLVPRIQQIYVMGGAIHVPGNLFGSALPGFDNSQEFNIWLDPASARSVLRTAPVRLIPLDATQFVPITPDIVDRIAADQHTPSARIVHRIISHPELTTLIGLGVMFWWDALAGLAAFRNDGDAITTFRPVRVDVVQTGAQSGRTAPTPTGSRLHAAFTADRTRFERTFLDALNGRAR